MLWQHLVNVQCAQDVLQFKLPLCQIKCCFGFITSAMKALTEANSEPQSLVFVSLALSLSPHMCVYIYKEIHIVAYHILG